MVYPYPDSMWAPIAPPLQQFPAVRLAPRVTRAKLGMRIALSERLAGHPLQALAVPGSLWQHMHVRKMNEQLIAPPLSVEDLSQGEMQADQILQLIEFVNACTDSMNQQLFVRRTSKGMMITKLGFSLASVLPILVYITRSDCEDLLFEPRIEAACRAFVKVGLHQMSMGMPQPWQFQDASWVTLFEEFGNLMRVGQRGASAGRAQQSHDDYHRKHLYETKCYFRKVARGHPSGHVLRLELEVALEGSADHRTRYLHMHRLSGAFNRQVALTYGDAVVGDARLMDRAGGNGYQAHVVLVFDGPSRSEMLAIEEALPGIWRDLATTGRLRALDATPRFQYRATGIEYRDYESLASQLDKAAVYMAGTSEIFRVSLAGVPAGLVLAEVTEIDPKRKK
ncbi:hypothetical protein APR51_43660 [Variovorax paradoxus]|jgi:hypothetical protein|nr:hypothetical protein APR52_17570 [Variovorax paradoxus]KPV06786.1 hypothetical protein APR51_43660 [Variovorax paradoxus]